MNARVASRSFLPVIAATVHAGASRDALLDGLGISEEVLNDPEGWISVQAWCDIWVRAVALTGEPALGIYAAERIDPGYFGVLEYAGTACATVGEAIPASARYFRLTNTWGRIDVATEGRIIRVSRHIVGDEVRLLPPQTAEFSFVAMVQVFRRAISQPLPLARATFRHAAPADDTPHRAFFGCPVVFGASRDAVELPIEAGEIPMRRPDPRLRALIDAHGQALLAKVDDPGASTSMLVRHELARGLPAGLPDLETIARRLGHSRRSLQRLLAEEGTSYRTIADELLRGLAERYLEAGMPPCEVAFLLGYSEVSSFHRAFLSWTGRTPGQHNARRQKSEG